MVNVKLKESKTVANRHLNLINSLKKKAFRLLFGSVLFCYIETSFKPRELVVVDIVRSYCLKFALAYLSFLCVLLI